MSKIVYVRFYAFNSGNCTGLYTYGSLRDARKALHDMGFVYTPTRDFDYVCEDGLYEDMYANICVTLAYEE